jgi:hypothetical protein
MDGNRSNLLSLEIRMIPFHFFTWKWGSSQAGNQNDPDSISSLGNGMESGGKNLVADTGHPCSSCSV